MSEPNRYPSTDRVVDAALRTLTPIEERVLRMRFGIGNRLQAVESARQQSDVARARLRQIESRALRKLRATALSGSLVGRLGNRLVPHARRRRGEWLPSRPSAF